MNKPSNPDSPFPTQLREMLDLGTEHLDHRVSVRLYEARCDALRHQAVVTPAFSLAGVGTLVGGVLHGRTRIALTLLALAIGVAAVQIWQNDQQANELADIDIQLLSDEVSPDAYTDPGFMEWLQHLSESDDDSLPE